METITHEGQESFSNLIGLIYDAAQDPGLWPELLERLDSLISETSVAGKTPDGPVIQERESELSILRPHFQRALQLNKRLYDLKSERDAVSNVLDRLPIGVILVDEQLTPIAINRHAEKILRADSALCIRDGKLCADTTTNTSKISQHVTQAAAIASPSEAGWNLMLGSGSSNPCSLHITPSAHAGIATEKQLVAIFISCAGISHDIGISTLTETYRLTQAEGRLLQTLLNGSHSLPEAAASLGVSKHTVRSQFKSILEKTGAHSQTELIKRILTGPAALIGEKQETLAIKDIAALESTRKVESPGCQRIKLVDGRTLEYRIHGDPNGVPVLFFHGCIHSRETLHPTSTYAESHGIRLIVPERPGFATSSLLPESHEPDHYARDIKQLMQHLAIDRFCILSDTSGAQAGFNCACFLPDQVIRMAAVTVYPEPRFDVPEKALKAERLMMKMYQTLPSIFHAHIARIITRELSNRPEGYFGRIMDQLPPADRKIVSSPEHAAIVAESFTNAYPHNIRGFTDDFMQRIKPWDFDINESQVETRIWHGTANTIVPFEAAETIARSLPNASLFPVEDGGHYIIISHWDQILENLVFGSA